MNKTVGVGVVVMLSAIAGIAYAVGDWGAAKDKVDRFKTEYDNLRRVTPEGDATDRDGGMRADEDDRRSVASDVHDRVASTISRKYDELAALKDDTVRKLDDVISDDALKDKQSDAKGYKDDVSRRWGHDRADDAFDSRQEPPGRPLPRRGRQPGAQGPAELVELLRCVRFSMSSGRADCLQASNCMVIELKPDNSRAISNGRSQVQRYRDELNSNADTRKKLVEKNSNFAKCEKFNYRVDCYKLCPDIDPGHERVPLDVDLVEDGLLMPPTLASRLNTPYARRAGGPRRSPTSSHGRASPPLLERATGERTGGAGTRRRRRTSWRRTSPTPRTMISASTTVEAATSPRAPLSRPAFCRGPGRLVQRCCFHMCSCPTTQP